MHATEAPEWALTGPHAETIEGVGTIPHGATVWTPRALERMPTIHSGHFCNLKMEAGGLRYFVSRCFGADGDPWQVHVEAQGPRGSWVEQFSYRTRQAPR